MEGHESHTHYTHSLVLSHLSPASVATYAGGCCWSRSPSLQPPPARCTYWKGNIMYRTPFSFRLQTERRLRTYMYIRPRSRGRQGGNIRMGS